METGIAPTVEMINGLSEDKEQREWEKEELALSCNLDRRQLDNEDAVQVFEARLNNLLDLQQKNPKKWTLNKIAKTVGVSKATVAARRDLRLNSAGGTVSKPDARRQYDDDLKREAVRLVKDGMPKADVARKLLIHPKAVDRAVNEEKERKAGGPPAKGGKRKKAAARRKEPIEDLAANVGPSELHRRVLEHLGRSPEDYANIQRDARDGARETLEKIFNDDAELLGHAVYGKYLMDFAQELLEERCRPGAEEGVVEEAHGASSPDAGGYEADEALDGAVHVDEPDVAPVSLPTGDRGAIADGDTGVTRLAVAEDGDEARVRVNGFDPEPGHPDRESMAQDDRTRAAEPNLDDRSSPYEKHFGRKREPKK
jgi:transposase-like protein